MGALALVKVLIARRLELRPVEAYSWMWAQHPQLGYFDHPAMTSWMVRASTALVGHSFLGVRAITLACSVGVIWILFDALRRLYDERTAQHVSLLVLLLPVTSVIGAEAAPDGPLLFFWCATLWAFVHALSGGGTRAWLLAGLFLGLALDSKYHAAVLAAGVLLFLWGSPEHRGWLRRREPYLAALVALVAFSPTLVWNAQHGFRSFLYQGSRIAGHSFTSRELRDFLLTQLLLVTPIVFVQAWARGTDALRCWRATSWQDRLLAAISMPTLLLFVAVAFFRPLRANWPAPGYLGAVALAGVAAVRTGGWSLRLQQVTLATLAVGYIALATGIQLAPSIWFKSWAQLAQATSVSSPDFVISSDYHLASELGYSNPRTPSFDLSPVGRPSKSFREWWHPDEFLGRHAVVVFDSAKPAHFREEMKLVRCSFDRVGELRRVSVRRIGGRLRSFTLVDAWGYRPPVCREARERALESSSGTPDE